MQPTSNGWNAQCPCHEDRKNSLCISEGKEGRVLLFCQAFCETKAIVEAIGLQFGDLFEPDKRDRPGKKGEIVARYDYRDKTGLLLYQAVRFEPKDFRQRTPKPSGGWEWKLNGVRRVLYRLPELLEADPAKLILIPEGEKDVDRLRSIGFVAICNVGGAGKWRDEYNAPLRGRHVAIIPDNDSAGRSHGEQVAKSLHGIAASVRVIELDGLPDKGDVSDWLNAGHTPAELQTLIENTPIWGPSELKPTLPKSGKVKRPEPISGGDSGDPLDVRWAEGQTDLANSRRFVKMFGDRARYCHAWGKWLIWDGARWKIDDTGAAMRLGKAVADAVWAEARRHDHGEALKFAAKTASDRSIRAMLSLAQSDLAVTPDQLDADPWLLNCPNGTLDLRTGDLRKHQREDLITKVTGAAFNPDAGSIEWDRFLEGVFDGDAELIGFVQRFFGYALTGVVRDHVLAVLYGTGANGKSTLIEAIMLALGEDYAAKASPDLLLMRRGDAHPTERADLFGRRFIAAVETGDGRRFNEALVKELTGGDTVKARRMREDFWSFRPTWKVALATNSKPAVRGTDHGIWRRIRLVPFTQTFDGDRQDRKLSEKLKAEAEGILAWALRGCLDWQAQGLGDPPAVAQATAAYRSEQDIIGEFLSDRCTMAEGATVRAKDLRTAFDEWATDAGVRVPSTTRIGTELLSRGVQKTKSNGVVYMGLAL